MEREEDRESGRWLVIDGDERDKGRIKDKNKVEGTLVLSHFSLKN